MGADFSGLIKIYLHKFSNEVNESIKDKSIEEKEKIFFEKLTSLFLSKYIIIIFSEKNLNPYYYFVNLSQSINKNMFLKIYLPFLDNLKDNNFAEKILQYNEKNDEILEIVKSLTNEIKDFTDKDIEVEKFENDLYTNNNSNINEFYAAIFKSGIDFLTSEKTKYDEFVNNIYKSSELLNIDERKIMINGLIDSLDLKRINYIQQIIILILIIKNENDLDKIVENEKKSNLIKILEKIKAKDNELQQDLIEYIKNQKVDFMNIEDLIKSIKI